MTRCGWLKPGVGLAMVGWMWAGIAAERVEDPSIETRFWRLESVELTTNDFNSGFFTGVRSEGGARLKVTEYAGRQAGDPWRALELAAAGGGPVSVSLRSAYPVRAIGPAGEIASSPGPDGKLNLQLPPAAAIRLETRLKVGEVAPGFAGDRFLIGASYAFPKDRPAEASQVQLLKAAGIDFGCANCRADERDKLELLAWQGLMMNTRENGRWWGGDGDRAGQMRAMKPMAEFERLARRLAGEWQHPALGMTDICDEPSALDMEYCGEVCARMLNLNPAVMPFVNIYPNYASVSWTSGKERVNQLGTPTYAEHVAAYCRTMPVDYICFDHYPFEDKPEDTLWGEKRFYDNYNDVERACVRTGRRMWFIGQVNTKPRCRQYLTENMLRFQAMAALTFGAESFIWATWYPSWWTNSVFKAGTLEKSVHYDRISRINAELHRLGAETIRYRHLSATYVAFPKWAKSVDAFANGVVTGLQAADGSRLVVGDMAPKDARERRRALVVFAAHDMADVRRQVRTVVFRAAGKVTVLGPQGELPCLADASGRYSFVLPDSSAAVVVIRES